MKPFPRRDFSLAFKEEKWEQDPAEREYYDGIWLILVNDMVSIMLVPPIPDRRSAWPPRRFDTVLSSRDARLNAIARSSYAIVADDDQAGAIERLPAWHDPGEGTSIEGSAVFFITEAQYAVFAEDAALVGKGDNGRGSAPSWIDHADLAVVRYVRHVVLDSDAASDDRQRWVVAGALTPAVENLMCPRCGGHRILDLGRGPACASCGLESGTDARAQ